jgi:hypothetical protein
LTGIWMCSPMNNASSPRCSTAAANSVIGMIPVLGMIDTPYFMLLNKLSETPAVTDCDGFLHPDPRVTAVAKRTATAAPLALSRDQAGEGQPSESKEPLAYARGSD